MLTPATSRPRPEDRTALEQLRTLLGEPSCWGRATPAIWEASERYLGFRLPADFKAFLDLYGPGSVDGYLTIDRPMDTTPAELERHWGPQPERPSWYGEIAEGCWEVDESDVQSGVLLLWGSDEHGSRYFFRAVEDVDRAPGPSAALDLLSVRVRVSLGGDPSGVSRAWFPGRGSEPTVTREARWRVRAGSPRGGCGGGRHSGGWTCWWSWH
ncbi:hypothetical protein [Kitasatospora sp. NBC_01300]|uniref:hypothetical protein n=1 Tax=Kitasatospora sp. NBC_01300 TaxID=2903574 RepID=UPI002F90972F|nr:SMI1/KNR4 family protein [Kitasatospora sp. NBC_01300]